MAFITVSQIHAYCDQLPQTSAPSFPYHDFLKCEPELFLLPQSCFLSRYLIIATRKRTHKASIIQTKTPLPETLATEGIPQELPVLKIFVPSPSVSNVLHSYSTWATASHFNAALKYLHQKQMLPGHNGTCLSFQHSERGTGRLKVRDSLIYISKTLSQKPRARDVPQ